MPPLVTAAPTDAAFATRRVGTAPDTVPPLPPAIGARAALHVDELRRALDLERRLAAALPAAVCGAAGRALREAAAVLLGGCERRAATLEEALGTLGIEPLRRATRCAEALVAELETALWDGEGDAADATLALALHRVAQLAAATHRGVRAACRGGGLPAVARQAAQAAHEHETAARRFLALAAPGLDRGAHPPPWRGAGITHSAA